MNDKEPPLVDNVSDNRHLLWLAIVVIGVVFFFVAHNFQVSRSADFAPWSEAGNTFEAGHNVLKGLALLSIGLLGAYYIIRKEGRPLQFAGWLPVLLLSYLAWVAASVLWSDDPWQSCRRLAVLLFCVFGAVGFARQLRPRDVAVMAVAITGMYFLVGLGTELALGTFRPWASGYRFAGTIHPNSQGANLTVFCLATFCLARSDTEWRAWLWTLFVVGLVLLLLTKSRTACAALAMVLGVLWYINLSGRAKVLTILVAAVIVSGGALVGTLFGVDIDKKVLDVVMLGRREESQTLTGRLPIWTELSGYVRERPFQGYGYAGFWSEKHIEAVSEEQQWPLREAHNAYIDAVLSIGLIGAAVLLAIVLLALRQSAVALRQTGDPGFTLTFCLLVFGLLHACLETGMADPNLTTLLAGIGVVQLSFPSLCQTARQSSVDPMDAYPPGLYQP